MTENADLSVLSGLEACVRIGFRNAAIDKTPLDFRLSNFDYS